MQTKVKICGISRDVDTEYLNTSLPDYTGFIINYPKSRRNITPQRAKELSKQLDPRIITVGVFVDNDLYEIAELANCGVIDVIQLHGNESEEYISHLRSETGAEIWKSFIVKTEADIIAAQKSSADKVLLDGGLGCGVSFDHSLISNIGREYILAGGLNISNIETSLKTIDPWAVDISSGVETDGVKDGKKISEIVSFVRNFSKII